MKDQIAGTNSMKKVLITRSRKGNAELALALAAQGLEPLAIDTLEFLPPEDWSQVDAALMRLGEFDWLIFTSATGVEHFTKRMGALSLSLRWDGKPRVGAVGQKTGDALRAQGVRVEFVPTTFVTRALAEQLPRDKGRRVLVLRADVGDPEAASILERAGFLVEDLAVYRTVQVSIPDKGIESDLYAADAVVFASPSAVAGFARILDKVTEGPVMRRRLLAVCIGPVTERAARQNGFQRILTSGTHTIEGILETLRAPTLKEEAR